MVQSITWKIVYIEGESIEGKETGEESETVYQNEETEIPYYQALLDNTGYPAPAKAGSTSGKQITAEGATFKKKTGTCYVAFARNNVLCRTDTITISGLNTDTDLSSQQQGIIVKATAGAGTVPNGFMATYGSTQATHKSSTGFYTSIFLPFSVVTSYGYSTVVTNATTNEYTFDGTSLRINIAKNAGVGTSSSSETSNATLTFNIAVPEYTFTYDGNGATAGPTYTEKVNNTNVTKIGMKQTYKKDETYQLPANPFTKKYDVKFTEVEADEATNTEAVTTTQSVTSNFVGWNVNQGGTIGAAPGATWAYTNNVTVYAIWSKDTITLPRPADRKNFTFTGWKLDGASEGTPLKNVGDTVDVTPNTSFTAQWEANDYSYTVKHYVQKEYGKTNKETDYELADEVTENLTGEQVVTLPYSDTAIALANSRDSKKYSCKLPQSQIVTINADGMVFAYYYDLEEIAPIIDPVTINIYNDYGLSAKQVIAIIDSINKNGNATIELKDGTKFTIVRNADGTFSIKFFATTQPNVVIPSYLKFGDKVYNITSISEGAFKNNASIKHVVISNGITTIGDYAFYNCKNLESVTMPNTVLKIGKYAYAKCPKLKKVSMSANCYEMGKGVFSDDKALTSITLGSKLAKVPDNAFKNCSKLKKITIPLSVTSIGKQAFYNCKALKNVNIKTKVLKKVGSKAFKKCKKGIKFKVPAKKADAYRNLLKGKY